MNALINGPPVFRGQDQSGASTLELALFLPLFLMLLFGTLGLSWTICEQYMIQRLHFSAARAGSLQASNCKTFAADDLQAAANRYRIPFNKNTDIVSAGSATVNGIAGFHMAVSIPMRCIACGLPGMGAAANYRADVFYPFMSETACQFEDIEH